MEGIIAVLGFWLVCLAIVLKKPAMAYIEKSKWSDKQVSEIKERIHQLESALVTIGKEVQDSKDTSEFVHKLLIDSAQQIADAHRLLVRHAQKLSDDQIKLTGHASEDSSPKVSVAQNTATGQGVNFNFDSGDQPKLLASEPKLLTAATPMISQLGKVIADGTLRFERVLPAPAERVWQYLTDPDCLEQWLAPGSIEQKFGGKVEFDFSSEAAAETGESESNISGVVAFIDPLRTITFSWNGADTNLQSSVCFQVSQDNDQTSLVITHSQLPHGALHQFMAAWHTRLDILKARLTNAVAPSFRKRYREVVQTYSAVVATAVVVSTSASAATVAMATPANAMVSQSIYQNIQSEKVDKLQKYDAIARDADDLKRQINILKSESANNNVTAALSRLEGELDNDNRDLHGLDMDIRGLESMLK